MPSVMHSCWYNTADEAGSGLSRQQYQAPSLKQSRSNVVLLLKLELHKDKQIPYFVRRRLYSSLLKVVPAPRTLENNIESITE